jgi:peroxiredoxin
MISQEQPRLRAQAPDNDLMQASTTMWNRLIGAVSLLLLFAVCQCGAAADPKPAVGQAVDDFVLQDFRGKEHRLSDYRDHQLVVLAFLGAECPLAKKYGPRLQKLADEYESKGVAFLGLNANVQDAMSEMAAYARIHEIKFPLLKDVRNQVADAIGADRTPEVFLLDQDRVVRYRGRVDDQYGVGYVRSEPAQQELKIAIDELLSGKAVTVPVTQTTGCRIGRIQAPKKDATVTYSNQIARIFQKRCVECHREGEIAPFELTKYDEVVGWAPMIDEVVRERRMPPWHADPKFGKFAGDRSLSDEEQQLIHQWVADGAPQGDPKQLPEPRQYVEGWQLPREPDQVIYVSDEPFKVKAEGEVKYQWFTVDPGYKEDKWLQAAEIIPGNRAVVHHILMFSRKAGEERRFNVRDGFLAGYVPGLRPRPLPHGMAKLIPAGSKLVFQVHYTPIGSEQSDRSKIGLIFADPAEITHQVQTTQAINLSFEIPPNAGNYEVAATSAPTAEEVLLLTLMPHMHLRGKSFRYEARYPDGATETLLNVPHFDFNWQTHYRLSEPKTLPAGTRLHCVAHYDNSEDNLNNPDPTKTVRWGDQTWEEMMIGYFDVAFPVSRDAAGKPVGRQLHNDDDPRAAAEALIETMDKDKDGKLSKNELPQRLALVFSFIDTDHDGVVSLDELTAAVRKQRERQPRRS